MKQVAINLFLLLLLITIVVISKPAIADSANDSNTQTNTSGSNTNITGGYTATTTNNNDGQTNTTTTTSTSTTSGSDIPVNSANSPSYSSMSQDVCSMGVSGSISTLGFGASVGKHIRDLNCERIKLSKVLYDYGMKVAAVSILCQDSRVHAAMSMSGTPCPWNGKIGKDAQEMWDRYPELRPDYEDYLIKAEAIAKIDAELLEIKKQKEIERIQKEQEEIARKIEEEKKKLATLKEQEEVDEEIDIIVIDIVPINIHAK
jgi:hypothetical protein